MQHDRWRDQCRGLDPDPRSECDAVRRGAASACFVHDIANIDDAGVPAPRSSPWTTSSRAARRGGGPSAARQVRQPGRTPRTRVDDTQEVEITARTASVTRPKPMPATTSSSTTATTAIRSGSMQSMVGELHDLPRSAGEISCGSRYAMMLNTAIREPDLTERVAFWHVRCLLDISTSGLDRAAGAPHGGLRRTSRTSQHDPRIQQRRGGRSVSPALGDPGAERWSEQLPRAVHGVRGGAGRCADLRCGSTRLEYDPEFADCRRAWIRATIRTSIPSSSRSTRWKRSARMKRTSPRSEATKSMMSIALQMHRVTLGSNVAGHRDGGGNPVWRISSDSIGGASPIGRDPASVRPHREASRNAAVLRLHRDAQVEQIAEGERACSRTREEAAEDLMAGRRDDLENGDQCDAKGGHRLQVAPPGTQQDDGRL